MAVHALHALRVSAPPGETTCPIRADAQEAFVRVSVSLCRVMLTLTVLELITGLRRNRVNADDDSASGRGPMQFKVVCNVIARVPYPLPRREDTHSSHCHSLRPPRTTWID